MNVENVSLTPPVLSEELNGQQITEQLNAFVFESIGKFLQNQMAGDERKSFEEELKKLIGRARSVAYPTDALQFLLHASNGLLLQKSSFEIDPQTRPLHLPIPVSLSWFEGAPLQVTTSNPALGVLLAGHHLLGEHEEYYSCMIGHIVKNLVVDFPDLLQAKQSIIFRQKHLEYRLPLTLLQVIFLFFPTHFVEVANKHPQHDFTQLLEALFTQARFGIRDVHFRSEIPGVGKLVDSLIVGDFLSNFPSSLFTNSSLREKLKGHISLLIHYGINPEGPMLMAPVVFSITKIAKRVLETAFDLNGDPSLQNALYNALQGVKKLANSSFEPPEGSFLLADLLGIRQKIQPPARTSALFLPTQTAEGQVWNFIRLFLPFDQKYLLPLKRLSAEKEVVFQTEYAAEQPSIVGAALLQGLLSRQGGLYFVVTPNTHTFAQELLHGVFYPASYHSWQVSSLRPNSDKLVAAFANHFQMHYNKHGRLYDMMLIKASRFFDTAQVYQLMQKRSLTRDDLKAPVVEHFKRLTQKLLFKDQRVRILLEVFEAVGKLFQHVRRVYPDLDCLAFLLAVWNQRYCTTQAFDQLPYMLDQLYTEPLKETDESRLQAISKSYFLLSQKLLRCGEIEEKVDNQVYYPETNLLLETLGAFDPNQLVVCTNGDELSNLFSLCHRFPNLPFISVISPDLLGNIQNFQLFKRPIFALINADADYYHDALVGQEKVKQNMYLASGSKPQILTLSNRVTPQITKIVLPVPNHDSFCSRSEEILDTVGRVEDAACLDEQVRPNTAEESKRSRRLGKNFRGWALEICAHWVGLKHPKKMGILHAAPSRGKEIFSFSYDDEWLKGNESRTLDPSLQLFTGAQYAPVGQQNFSLFLDSAPDRWGRLLMDRREAFSARMEGRKERQLLESDYLLGVYDEHRMGALRFRTEPEGPFLDNNKALASPPWTSLRELEQASLELEKDDAELNPNYAKWLQMLIAPGSSLGGARPKASVLDEEKHLWIAKFPSLHDDMDIGAWEMVVHNLAREAKVSTPEAKLAKFHSRSSTFLSKRFDRNSLGERIHFASAMTLLQRYDGDDASKGASYLELAEFIIKEGGQPEHDLEELWRRIIFFISVSNVDDHLRNHGFLLQANGWKLAPAYDVNPVALGNGLKLNISESDNSQDLALAREVADYFRIDSAKASKIIREVTRAVKNWRKAAASLGIGAKEQERMARAFRVADAT